MRDYLRKKYFSVSRILRIRFLYTTLIKPRSSNEDEQRKEYVLNIILVSTIGLLIPLGISLLVSYLHPQGDFSGISPLMYSGLILFFSTLLLLSRRGDTKISSLLIIIIYSIITLYCVYKWSFVLPMIILSSVLTIVISSILISTRFSFILTVILSLCVIGITYLQTHNIIPLDLYWQHDPVSIQDVIEMSVLFFFISGIAWLSNNETEKSLRRAHLSEQELINERNLLEIKIEERTRELKKLQLDEISQLSQLADIGKLSTGIFHDLMNPLNSVIANVDLVSNNNQHLSQVKSSIEKAVIASKRLGDQLVLLRKQIKPNLTNTPFSPVKEIQDAIDILGYKLRIKSVVCILERIDTETLLIGNPLFFHQVAINLLSNAIDSYSDDFKQRRILVRLYKENDSIVFSVQDFGCGISSTIQEHVFKPLFTTKDSTGLGVGLAHVKHIIENEFHGSISFSSIPNKGSTFIVTIPVSNI